MCRSARSARDCIADGDSFKNLSLHTRSTPVWAAATRPPPLNVRRPMPERSVCESVVRQLWPYLDGTLDEAERDRVVAHLVNCERCTSHMDFARAFLEAVGHFGPRATV